MEQPVTYWEKSDGSPWTSGGKSSIAPSGMAFVTSERYPGWKGNLFLGSLRGQSLVRLEVNGRQVLKEERYFDRQLGRIRDVRQGPDGWLYLLTDHADGRIVRVER